MTIHTNIWSQTSQLQFYPFSELRRLALDEMEVLVEEENPLIMLWNKVLQTPLLLELILDYVIHDKHKSLIPEVCSTRLVSKDWLLATNRLVAKSQKAVFRIPLTRENSTTGSAYVEKHGKVLDQFSSSLTLRKDKPAPLFSINVSPDFFWDNTPQKLLKCLTEYGNNLVELRLPLDMNRNPKPLNTGTWLPNLRSLSVGVKCRNSVDLLLDFVKSVFGASEQLTAITLKWPPTTTTKKLENFVLPMSITNVSLPVLWTKRYLQMLLNNPLPLKTLKLQGVPTSLQTFQLIFNVLQHFRGTLEVFHLCRAQFKDFYLDFRMPLMEKLRFFRINMLEVQLDENVSAEELHLLPLLGFFTVCTRRAARIGPEGETLRFGSVTSLRISCYKSESLYHGVQDIETLLRLFPKLLNLNLTIDEVAALRLKDCWRDLAGLLELSIRFVVRDKLLAVENCWDEFFTGFSNDKLGGLEKMEQTSSSSITALNGLEKLHLETVEKYDISLISDTSFKFAFLRMPKLSKLVLSGDFSASREVKQAWEDQGTVFGTQRELLRMDDGECFY